MNFFDLHSDTAYKMYTQNQGFYENSLAVSGEKGEIFENWHQTFAVWLPDQTENPFAFYKSVLSNLKNNLSGNVEPDFSVEGGTVLENNADRLYTLKADGIKFLQNSLIRTICAARRYAILFTKEAKICLCV